MSVAERLEAGLAFLQARSWGQTADRQECKDSPDGYAYCARGALIYGAFASEAGYSWCPDRAEWHAGPCTDDDDPCGNDEYAPPAEWDDAKDALDAGAEALGGRWTVAVDFNDALRRTKGEVEEMFKVAIEKAKASG